MREVRKDPEHRARARSDLQQLETVTATVVEHAHTYVAHLADPSRHRSAMQPEDQVTWQEIHDCIDLYARLVNRYGGILAGIAPTMFEEVITEPWEYAFRFAWVADNHPQ